MEGADFPTVNHGVVTPYSRSGLPTQKMSLTYQRACATLVHTGHHPKAMPRKPVPGMSNPRVPKQQIKWVGIDAFDTGEVSRFQ